MSEIINKAEALRVIEVSDFVQSRLPQAQKSEHRFEYINNIFTRESRKEVIYERQLVRNVLRAFEEQRPKSLAGDGYIRADLEDWLEALLADEVEKEFGPIPKV